MAGRLRVGYWTHESDMTPRCIAARRLFAAALEPHQTRPAHKGPPGYNGRRAAHEAASGLPFQSPDCLRRVETGTTEHQRDRDKCLRRLENCFALRFVYLRRN